MIANEIKEAGRAPEILHIGDVLDGWRSIPGMFRDCLNSTDMAYSSTQEILITQNEVVMRMIEDPNTSDERFAEACQHAREIRNDAQTVSANRMADDIKIISMFLSIIAIAIGGSHTIKK